METDSALAVYTVTGSGYNIIFEYFKCQSGW